MKVKIKIPQTPPLVVDWYFPPTNGAPAFVMLLNEQTGLEWDTSGCFMENCAFRLKNNNKWEEIAGNEYIIETK